jgi:hypothetical protein
MQVREEHVVHIDSAVPTLHEPMMRTGAVIHDDEIIADLEEVSGALPLE